ncbi:MAG TPA: M42 family metallopeptidase [Flexilinea sp.]|jgi:endoglucanase|nr:M42 family metallopeptidase [Flexilinea sp.]HPR69884.1 M42 family metallopeptidase [Flexilinea sp.]
MKNLLEKLTQTTGVSGYENEIREVIRKEIEPFADDIQIDVMGNLIARKGIKKSGGKRIMISSHMDEIGLMASHINDKGFVYVATIGGVNPLTCFSARVKFLNGTEGVVYAETQKMDKVPTVDQLFVDVGADSAETCPVKVGDEAVFVRSFLDMGNRVVSKAIDDRIGCLVAIETIKALKDSPNELFFVFSTQEEVGLRGAKTSAFSINPEMGIAVDVTLAADVPHCEPGNPVLGKGPCIKVRDGSLIAHPKVIDAMKKAADRTGIEVQMEVLSHSGTDAGAIQLVRSGVPAGCLSIACRYVHSPSEMVDINDVSESVRLLVDLLSNPVDL